MSLFDDASLVLIPDGAKDGTLYSVKPTDGTGDFTFTRGSNLAATRVDENGLIEKGRENLLVQSNQFDTTWTTNNASVTGGQAGYDGTNDAWEFEATSTASCNIIQNISQSGVQSFSIYAKAGTTDWIRILGDATTDYLAFFDLTNGIVGATLGGANIDTNIESVGGGWYRCSISGNASITRVILNIASGNNDTSTTVGDTIYIQDAQLEAGLVATDYIETGATTAQAGILEDMPRLDYSGGTCPALLLEPQRTNLVVNSEYYNTSDWSISIGNATATNNAATSPEGVDNAIKLAENTSVSSFHYIGESTAGVTTAGTYSISGFVKKGSRRYGGLRAVTNGFVNRYFVLVDLDNGSLATTNTFGSGVTWSHEIKDYGNGWYRIEIMGGHTIGTIDGSFSLSDTSSPSFSGGLPVFNGVSGEHIFCYGLQKELGSYPTSYIPTYGSSVTRSAEVCTKTSATALIGQTEGTLYAEVEFTGNTGGRFLSINDGTSANRILIARNSNNSVSLIVSTSSATQAAITTGILADGLHKFGVSYETDEFVFYVDGTLIGTDTSGVVPACSVIDIGNENGLNVFGDSISQAILFPTRISNTELAALTTL